MKKARGVGAIFQAKETIDGAGVRLKRAIDQTVAQLFDPFLLLDHFGSDDPTDWEAGFPWHPHRGIETVTYVLRGRVEHEDSEGNKGTIRAGDIQWMMAGSGIYHQEMPKPEDRALEGFQLWLNLPAKEKMINPRYFNIESSYIPAVKMGGGGSIRVIAGSSHGVTGPVVGSSVDPLYLDVELPPFSEFKHEVPPSYTVFSYIYRGTARFNAGAQVPSGYVVLLIDGSLITIRAGPQGTRLLLAAGRPIGEPIAWYGPIVMNTWEQINEALVELRNGSFVKKKAVIF